METILVVDDEKNYLLVMAALLSDQGYEALTAENGVQALELIEEADLDLVLTDMKMPQMDGIELLTRISKIRPELPVIMMTAFGTVEKAVEAMKTGAFDYITKPFQNEELMLTIGKALDMHRLVRENRELTQELRQRDRFENIIGKNRAMKDIFRLIEKVADTQANVLITGDSGTGKELTPGPFTRVTGNGGIIPLSPSTAPPCPKRFWKVNCSATKKEPLPEP